MDRVEWVLVPRKATPEMLAAVKPMPRSLIDEREAEGVAGYRERMTAAVMADRAELAQRYEELIAAAPPPPAEQASVEVLVSRAAVRDAIVEAVLDHGSDTDVDPDEFVADVMRRVPKPAGEVPKCVNDLLEMRAKRWPEDPEIETIDAAIAALSQRPVVDGAMMQRAMEAFWESVEESGCTPPSWPFARDTLTPRWVRAALTAAPAPQQQGGS